MTTAGLITFIQRRAPDYDRPTILMLLNEIQKMVFKSPNELMLVIDETTGELPLLTTVAGTLVYELDVPSFGWDIQFIDSRGKSYSSVNSTPSANAKVIFSSDPGDNEYEIRCFRKPYDLTSEHINLDIPEDYHLEHMVKGVVGKIEEGEHGTSNTWQLFYSKLLPEMQWEIGKTINNKIVYTKGQGY